MLTKRQENYDTGIEMFAMHISGQEPFVSFWIFLSQVSLLTQIALELTM